MRKWVLVVACCFLSSTACRAGTWHVFEDGSGDAPTIQLALDWSTAGDTILVAPGLYYETLDMRDGRILISEAGPELTIIDALRSGTVIRCAFIYNETLISGFTLRNGSSDLGGGLYCEQSSLTFEHNILCDNAADQNPAYGGGIYTTRCPPSMLIFRNLLYRNSAYIGAGICCNGSDRSTLVGNTVVDNRSHHGAGIITYNNSAIVIYQNLVAMNQGVSGYGIYIHTSSSAWITCSNVWMNAPADYHGTDVTGILGNISADPLFCDAELDDYSLDGDSPCLPGNHPDGDICGFIGAREQGCDFAADGACCFLEYCVMMTEEVCDSYGGSFQGEEIDCDPNPCPMSDVVDRTSGTRAAELRVIPNPATGPVTMQCSAPEEGSIGVEIFDSSGRLIRRVCWGALETDLHSLVWDGRDGAGGRVASGVYFVRLRTSHRSMVQPLVLAR